MPLPPPWSHDEIPVLDAATVAGASASTLLGWAQRGRRGTPPLDTLRVVVEHLGRTPFRYGIVRSELLSLPTLCAEGQELVASALALPEALAVPGPTGAAARDAEGPVSLQGVPVQWVPVQGLPVQWVPRAAHPWAGTAARLAYDPDQVPVAMAQVAAAPGLSPATRAAVHAAVLRELRDPWVTADPVVPGGPAPAPAAARTRHVEELLSALSSFFYDVVRRHTPVPLPDDVRVRPGAARLPWPAPALQAWEQATRAFVSSVHGVLDADPALAACFAGRADLSPGFALLSDPSHVARCLTSAGTLDAVLARSPDLLALVPRAHLAPLLTHPDRRLRVLVLAALARRTPPRGAVAVRSGSP